MRRRTVRTGHLLGILGGLVAFWATMFTGGDLEFRVAITTVALAWGAGIGALVGSLAGASPARTTLPLGLGALLGGIGAIGGTAFGVHVLGQDLIDGNGNVLLASAFVGAGIGWAVGAAGGVVVGEVAPSLTRTQIRVARAVAIGIVVAGALIALSLGEGIDPGSAPRRHAGWMQVAAIADAILVAATLAFIAGTSPKGEPATPPLPARALARVGLTMGCVVLVTMAACQPGVELGRRVRVQEAVNERSASSLADAGIAYALRTGKIPGSVETLVEAGARVAPGSTPNGVWRVPRGFCVEVGTDADRLLGVPPLYSVSVRFRPTRLGGLREKVWSSGGGGCEVLNLPVPPVLDPGAPGG